MLRLVSWTAFFLAVWGCTGLAGGVDPPTSVDPDASVGVPDASVELLSCDVPPAATCASAQVLRTYSSPGSRGDGGCAYPSVDVQCDAGCIVDHCLADPCANVSCKPTEVCRAGICQPKTIPGDVTTTPYTGVTYTTGVRNGANFILVVADPTKVTFEVRHVNDSDNRDIPSRVAAATQAQIVTNAGEYDPRLSGPYFPKLPAISNGVTRHHTDPDQAQPRLMFTQAGLPSFDSKTSSSAWNMTTGLRFLMVDGVIPSYVYSTTKLSYTEKHSRTILGIDATGNVMVLVVNKFPGTTLGLTFLECAELMQQYGAWTIADFGGGGDSSLVKDGVLQNIPDDFDPGSDVHYERGVVQFLVMYAK